MKKQKYLCHQAWFNERPWITDGDPYHEGSGCVISLLYGKQSLNRTDSGLYSNWLPAVLETQCYIQIRLVGCVG